MNRLAQSTYDTGHFDEALKMREAVLALRRKVLGPEHPDTLNTMHYLAFSYHKADLGKKAIAMLEEVLASRRKVLGAEHPDVDIVADLEMQVGGVHAEVVADVIAAACVVGRTNNCPCVSATYMKRCCVGNWR